MNFIDAFLWATALSYYVYAALGGTVKGWKPLLCALSNFLCGTMLALNMVLNNSTVWVAFGLVWAAASAASYFGLVKWNVKWYMPNGVSESTQNFMAFWDIIISVCCLMKA